MLAAPPICGSFHPWIGRRSSVRAPAKLKLRRNEAQGQGGELSGSDVLRALQRASVKKSNSKGQPSSGAAQAQGSEQDASGAAQAQAQAQGLRIKSEWRFRLEELDKRLRQIMLLDQP